MITARTCPNHPGEQQLLEGIGTPFFALHGTRSTGEAAEQPQHLSPTAQMQVRIWRCPECGYLQLQDFSFPGA